MRAPTNLCFFQPENSSKSKSVCITRWVLLRAGSEVLKSQAGANIVCYWPRDQRNRSPAVHPFSPFPHRSFPGFLFSAEIFITFAIKGVSSWSFLDIRYSEKATEAGRGLFDNPSLSFANHQWLVMSDSSYTSLPSSMITINSTNHILQAKVIKNWKRWVKLQTLDCHAD